MEWHDFRWRGLLASDMGVIVETQVGYSRPAERVNQVQVPGRSGTLTLSGDTAWENVVYSPGCYLKRGANKEAVLAWLRGSGQVVFGSMPDYAFDARLINQIDYKHLWEGDLDGYKSFTPVFDCQPLRREAVPAAETTFLFAGGVLTHPGTAPARPMIQVVGTGDVWLKLGECSVQLSALAGGIVLDCERQDALSLDGKTLLSGQVDGEYPVMQPGDNVVTWLTGEGASVTQVTVQPRWRWL